MSFSLIFGRTVPAADAEYEASALGAAQQLNPRMLLQ
jgi:hypothetical protein